MKIRLRLTLWFTSLVMLLGCAGALIGWLGLQSQVDQLANTELHDKRHEIRAFIDSLTHEFSRQGLSFELGRNLDSLQEIFANDQTSLDSNIFIQVTDPNGRILARSSNLGQGTLPFERGAAASGPASNRPLPLQLNGRQTNILYDASPIVIKGKIQGHLQLGLSMTKTEHLLRQFLILESLGILFSLVFSLILGQFLAQRALAPMLRITGQVQQMAGKDLFRRLDTASLSQDEIGILAGTFNGLLERIEQLFVVQQHFITDASHEFRTPLTAIRGHAQLIEKRGSDELLRLKSAASIIRETRRMSRLVDDLLMLARLESHVGQYERLELVELARELDEDFAPLYPMLRLDIQAPALWVMGHSDSLRRVLINLVDNAAQAVRSVPEPQISLSCRQRGQRAEISILDNGCGIAAEHLPHLFERFYRIEHDRNRDSGGSGIGLALAHDIVRLHQGELEVSSTQGQGTCFRFSLPLAQPARSGLLK